MCLAQATPPSERFYTIAVPRLPARTTQISPDLGTLDVRLHKTPFASASSSTAAHVPGGTEARACAHLAGRGRAGPHPFRRRALTLTPLQVRVRRGTRPRRTRWCLASGGRLLRAAGRPWSEQARSALVVFFGSPAGRPWRRGDGGPRLAREPGTR